MAKKKDAPPPKPHKDDKPEDKGETLACVEFNSVYLYVAVTCFPALYFTWKEKKYSKIGDAILHELCHGFLAPLTYQWNWDDPPSLKQQRQDTVERQTQRITNSINDLLPKEWYMPKAVLAWNKKK